MEIPNWWWYNVVLQFGPIIHGDGHVDISEDGFLAADGRMEFWDAFGVIIRNVGQTTPCLPSPSHHHKFVGGINLPFPEKWVVYLWPCFTHGSCEDFVTAVDEPSIINCQFFEPMVDNPMIFRGCLILAKFLQPFGSLKTTSIGILTLIGHRSKKYWLLGGVMFFNFQNQKFRAKSLEPLADYQLFAGICCKAPSRPTKIVKSRPKKVQESIAHHCSHGLYPILASFGGIYGFTLTGWLFKILFIFSSYFRKFQHLSVGEIPTVLALSYLKVSEITWNNLIYDIKKKHWQSFRTGKGF